MSDQDDYTQQDAADDTDANESDVDSAWSDAANDFSTTPESEGQAEQDTDDRMAEQDQ